MQPNNNTIHVNISKNLLSLQNAGKTLKNPKIKFSREISIIYSEQSNDFEWNKPDEISNGNFSQTSNLL